MYTLRYHKLISVSPDGIFATSFCVNTFILWYFVSDPLTRTLVILRISKLNFGNNIEAYSSTNSKSSSSEIDSYSICSEDEQQKNTSDFFLHLIFRLYIIITRKYFSCHRIYLI